MISIIVIATASDISQESALSEINDRILHSDNITKPYYTSGISEWNSYWNSFILKLNDSKELYLNLIEKTDLSSGEINNLVLKKQKLQREIEIIEGIITLDESFGYNGLEKAINDQSKTSSGANRLRAYYNDINSQVDFLLSEEMQSQSFSSGISGTGLKSSIKTIMNLDGIYQVKSGSKTVNIYNDDGTKKTDSDLEDEAKEIAIDWVGGWWNALFGKCKKLVGKSEEFIIISKTSDGTIFERNYIFNFLDAGIQTFNPDNYYCILSGNMESCNKIIYEDWNSKILNIEDIKHGESANYITIPFKEHYTFIDWGANLSNIVTDIKVTAQYLINHYQVLFKDYDESILSDQIVNHGDNAISPEIPFRKNYNFTGWNLNFTNIKSNLTITAQYQIIISNISDENITYNINSSDENISIDINENISIVKIDISSLITNGTGIIPKIVINSLNTYNITVNIPQTNISTTNISWNGIINSPTITNTLIPAVEGKTRTKSIAIEIGFLEGTLLFDEAVQIILPQQNNKKVGYLLNNTFSEITNICKNNTQEFANNLSNYSECYINSGSDLVIWTKHFTEFITYDEVLVNVVNDVIDETDETSSSSGGSSKTSSLKNTCIAQWNCTGWSDCINNTQTRFCYDKEKCSKIDINKPTESRDCIPIEQEKDIIELNTKPIKTGFGLGAVIGDKTSQTLSVFIIFIIILCSLMILVYYKIL